MSVCKHFWVSIFRFCLVTIICDQNSASYHGSSSSDNFNSVVENEPFWGSRIIGGRFARKNEFPSIVALRDSTSTLSHLCGGTLINSKWVVSAAHCFDDVDDLNSISVVAGAHIINSNEADQQIRTPSRIIPHPDYTPELKTNDIALIEVDSEFIQNQAVKPIQLQPNNSQIQESSKGIIAGWGFAYQKAGKNSDILRKGEVSLVQLEKCKDIWKSVQEISPSMLCAGMDGVDACFGDDGFPLYCRVIEEGRSLFLCGIVSFGTAECGSKSFPSVYTRITSFADWINETITEESESEEE